METPSFAELKAGLELPFRNSLEKPSDPASYICGLNIRGQFYSDLWLSLSPNCNALIGVKGSGKTSILECLRYALGAPVPESRKESVSAHLNAILGTAGSVRVLVKRADGAKLLIERELSSPKFKVTFEDNRQELFSNPEGIMFPAYILGWHEIEQAATDREIRRVYLDTIAGLENIRQFQDQADAAAKQINHIHSEASHRYSALQNLHRQITRLEEMRKGLQELTDDNLIELRNQYETAVKHKDAVQELRRATTEMLEQFESRATPLRIEAEPESFSGDSPLLAIANEAYEAASGVTTQLADIKKGYFQAVGALNERLRDLSASADYTFSGFSTEYETKISALPKEKRQLLETHRKVMEDTKALSRLTAEKDAREREVADLLQNLIHLCHSVADSLDAQTLLRKEKVEEINKKLLSYGVRLSVNEIAQSAQFSDLTTKFSDGARIFGEIASFSPDEKRHHRRLAKAYEALKTDLIDGYHLFFESAQFDQFTSYFEDDDLIITFKSGKTGEEFSPIDQLSAGQRCTAVFPLLLQLREGPLIVDQPEDNLDNRHIADAIAPALSEDKKTRQIAFTSHNANLVVLTDAEHIVMFEATGSQGHIEARGYLSTSKSRITKDVISILDGGEDALRLRYKKYGTA